QIFQKQILHFPFLLSVSDWLIVLTACYPTKSRDILNIKSSK
ncbi:MAG: hypothetical protein ACI9LY_000296, partial [Arenicella sp.]